ncbi:MAG: ATP-binding protein [Desulfovibrio sp.]|nr:ATP-binding protein [Desulfovibrio sp.]
MKEIVVISGKGGTGKTSITCALAHLAKNTVFCDLDVDVPDMHIILDPKPQKTEAFMGGNKAIIQQELCVACGTCQELCHFAAITEDAGRFTVDHALCEGCGVCFALCPQKAISFPEALCGHWSVSDTRFGPFVHALLKPGEENSGKLVSLLKKEARALAKELGYTTLLCDGSPGIGCPVVSSLAGASLALAVVEPSLSGQHDFQRVAGVCAHFQIPVAVIINRYDLNCQGSEALEALCQKEGYPLFGKIPFSPELQEASQKGLAITELKGTLADNLAQIWERIERFQPRARSQLRSLQATRPS